MTPLPALRVLDPGPLCTFQDLGRPGHARLGVGRSGAADRASLRAANAIVGNTETAAGLEVTFGGLHIEAVDDVIIGVAGAVLPDVALGTPIPLATGQRLRLRTPHRGLRSYVAVRGGFAAESVLGSRSTDVLGGIGPAPLARGDLLVIGADVTGPPRDVVVPVIDEGDPLVVEVAPGPRQGEFPPAAWPTLTTAAYAITADANRIAARLTGPPVPTLGTVEPEGLVEGAVQVPPDGRPIVFLADHPLTGGYPVVAVVTAAGVCGLAQARPGTRVRFRPAS